MSDNNLIQDTLEILSSFECLTCSSNIKCIAYDYNMAATSSIFDFKCHDVCFSLNIPDHFMCLSYKDNIFTVKRIIQAYFFQVIQKNSFLRIKSEDWVLLQGLDKHQTRSWLINELWKAKEIIPVVTWEGKQINKDIDRVKTQRLLELRGREQVLGDWEPECISDKPDKKEIRAIKKANKRLILF